MAKHEFILVEFYQPYCPWCRKFKPEFDAAAKGMLQMDPPVPMGMYNIRAQPGASEVYGIRGTPTVKFFYKGKAVEDHRGWNKDWILGNVRRWVAGVRADPNKYDHIALLKPQADLYKA